jgi:hypothetical protein
VVPLVILAPLFEMIIFCLFLLLLGGVQGRPLVLQCSSAPLAFLCLLSGCSSCVVPPVFGAWAILIHVPVVPSSSSSFGLVVSISVLCFDLVEVAVAAAYGK